LANSKPEGKKKIGIASGKWQDRREEKVRNSKWQLASHKGRIKFGIACGE
jgi:hypothetical protein